MAHTTLQIWVYRCAGGWLHRGEGGEAPFTLSEWPAVSGAALSALTRGCGRKKDESRPSIYIDAFRFSCGHSRAPRRSGPPSALPATLFWGTPSPLVPPSLRPPGAAHTPPINSNLKHRLNSYTAIQSPLCNPVQTPQKSLDKNAGCGIIERSRRIPLRLVRPTEYSVSVYGRRRITVYYGYPSGEIPGKAGTV